MTFTWGGNGASPNAYRVRPLGALGGAVDFERGQPPSGGRPRRSAARPASSG